MSRPIEGWQLLCLVVACWLLFPLILIVGVLLFASAAVIDLYNRFARRKLRGGR